MNKKRGTLLLSGLMAASVLLGACSGNNSQRASGPAAGSQGEDEKVKLVVWIWETAKAGIDLNMDRFKEAYPNIDVEFQVMKSTDLYQKYLVSSNTDDAVPDVLALESTNLSQMVEINSLLDITGRVAPYKDKIVPYKWKDATLDDKVYAMPWDSGPVVMFYRNDLFAKAGLPTDPDEVAAKIQTWDDYYEAAKLVKEKTGAFMYGDSKTNSSNRVFESMMWQRGLWYFGEDGKVMVDSAEGKEIADYWLRMQREGVEYDARAESDPLGTARGEGKMATVAA
ncbi:hypothetical protein AMQ83_29185, partial [Paenibacillus riograndensis]